MSLKIFSFTQNVQNLTNMDDDAVKTYMATQMLLLYENKVETFYISDFCK